MTGQAKSSINRLTRDKRVQVISALVEGNSIRSTVRMTGISKNTITKLLVEVGQACEEYHDKVMVNLPCQRLQVDEIWSFCYCKRNNVPDDLRGHIGYGDVWTWVALDADTKLVPSWMVGGRDSEWAYAFMSDLADRLSNRVQLTTDGHSAYLSAVRSVFGRDIDYATLVKLYGKDSWDETKYSPGEVIGCKLAVMSGRPDTRYISTSHVERQNLNMRMSMRRFTRLTNGFSKKVENLHYAVALHFMYYNFCRIHMTLKTTPAVRAGISDHIWKIGDIVELLENRERSN